MPALKRKKGDPTDVIVLIILVFFLAVSLITAVIVNDVFKDAVSTTALNNTDTASDVVDSYDTINFTTVQQGFVAGFGVLVVGVLVSAWLARFHPAFMFIWIFTLLMAIILSVYLGNIYADFTSVARIAEIADQQTMINVIMNNITIIMVGVGILSIIIAFAKRFRGPSFGGEDI